jgi:hypothetical protein
MVGCGDGKIFALRSGGWHKSVESKKNFPTESVYFQQILSTFNKNC